MAMRSLGPSTIQRISRVRRSSRQIQHESSSVKLKQIEQRRTFSFTSKIALDSPWASDRLLRKIWKASLEAVFFPIPGSFVRASIRLSIGLAWSAIAKKPQCKMQIAKLTMQGVRKNPYPLDVCTLILNPAFFSALYFAVFIL